MEAILAKIESQGGKATEAQKERLEELQDDLADGQGDEFATIKDLKQFQREARKQALEEFRAEAAAIRQAEEAARRFGRDT